MNTNKVFKRGIIPSFIVVLSGAGFLYYTLFSSAFSIKETHYIYVDGNDSQDSVVAKIKKEAHPNTTIGFSLLSTCTDYKVKTGRYAVLPEENIFSMFRKLQRGRQEPVNLAIPSVRTLDRLAGTLNKKLMLDSVTLAQAFTDSAFCRKYGYDTATLACLFIPNTYQVYWDISLDDLMKRMQSEYQTFWNKERLSKAEKAGLTPHQVTTIASIVDEETAANSEKPMVAGMYINRYRINMPLQADPTIKFALKDFSLRRIYHKHLTINSPYNTYKNPGLPPGPIRIPSIVGIDAVLNYVGHNYLYMCAKEDFSGTHNFAKTYSEHLSNAAKYSAALNKRGIK